MGDIISWSIFGTVMVLAIGVAYNAMLKSAESSHSLKLANDEITRLRKQVDAAQGEVNKSALQGGSSNLSILSKDPFRHLTFDEKTGTWAGADSLHYCPKCRSSNNSSPMRDKPYGWECPVCNYYASDPERPDPIDPNPGSWLVGKAKMRS